MISTPQQYKNAYKKQPEVIRAIVASSEYSNFIDEASKKVNLDKKGRDAVAAVTTDVLIGITPKDNFLASLRQEGVPEFAAITIVQEMTDAVINGSNQLYEKILKNIEREEEEIEKNAANNKPVNLAYAFAPEISDVIIEYSQLFPAPTVPSTTDRDDTIEKIKNGQESEYVKSLPLAVQKLVMDKTWCDRVSEISVKYSLDQSQTETLMRKVLSILAGLEKPLPVFSELSSDLFISQMLANQIVEDVSVRVFGYALSKISDKTKTVNSGNGAYNNSVVESYVPQSNKKSEGVPVVTTPKYAPEETKTLKEELIKQIPNVPDNLPGIAFEPEEKNLETKPSPDTSSAPGIIDWSRLKSDAAKEKPLGEKVQAPLGVPRFSQAAPEETSPVAPERGEAAGAQTPSTPATQNVGKNPLTEPTVSPSTAPVESLPKKYSVDPYREPIE